MFFGNINNEFFDTQCAVLPKPLSSVLHFLKDTDLKNHEAGKFDISLGGVNCILQVLDFETKDREELKPEIHRKFIDVQFLASGGPEDMAFFVDEGSSSVDEDLLNTQRDILFYNNNENVRESNLCMEVGSYVCFFPWDVHIPQIKVGSDSKPIRKIVIKVPVDACI